jgi:hypothetical protein
MPRDFDNSLEEEEDEPGPFALSFAITCVAIGFGPLVSDYFLSFWGNPGFFIFPVALLAAAWAGLRAVREFDELENPGSRLGFWLLFLLAAALLIKASLEWRPGLAFGVLLFSIGIFFWNHGGWSLACGALPAIGLAALCSPPAVQVIGEWSEILRDLASGGGAAYLLSLCAVPATIAGGELVLTGGRSVPILCDRCVNGLFLAWILAIAYPLLRRRPFYFFPLTIVGSTAGLVFADAFGIVAMGLNPVFFTPPAVVNGWIAALSILVAIAGIFLVDLLLARRFLWPSDSRPASPSSETGGPRSPWGFRSQMVPLVLLVAGAIQGFHVWKASLPPDKNPGESQAASAVGQDS